MVKFSRSDFWDVSRSMLIADFALRKRIGNVSMISMCTRRTRKRQTIAKIRKTIPNDWAQRHETGIWSDYMARSMGDRNGGATCSLKLFLFPNLWAPRSSHFWSRCFNGNSVLRCWLRNDLFPSIGHSPQRLEFPWTGSSSQGVESRLRILEKIGRRIKFDYATSIEE